MSIKWRDFESFIKPDMPGCPRKTVADAARSAAIEFCKVTQLWRLESELSVIMADHAIYTPDTPDDVEISAIIKVQLIKRNELGEEIGRTELLPLNDSDLSRMGNWESLKDKEPRYYRTHEPNRVQLIPAPTETLMESLVMTIAVKPSYGSKLCPQFLLSSHAEAIGYGAKAQLAAIPNKTWSNPSMVPHYRQEFQSKMNSVTRNQNTANSRKSLRVRGRRFI